MSSVVLLGGEQAREECGEAGLTQWVFFIVLLRILVILVTLQQFFQPHHVLDQKINV